MLRFYLSLEQVFFGLFIFQSYFFVLRKSESDLILLIYCEWKIEP